MNFGTKIFDVNIIAAIENTQNESFMSIENPLIGQTLFQTIKTIFTNEFSSLSFYRNEPFVQRLIIPFCRD